MSPATLAPPVGPRLDHAWEVLERFGEGLQQCDQAAAQIRLLLASTQQCLDADAVVWHPGIGEEGFTVVGKTDLSDAWLRAFVESLQGRGLATGEQFLHRFDPAAFSLSPWPASVALVRISKTRGSWLMALGFAPGRPFADADLKVMRLARRMVLNHRQQAQTYDRLRESLFDLVRCLTAAIDAKDPYTWGHSERVARIAVRLGKQLAVPAGTQSDLYLAGLLHDIGKIGIRDSVLLKEGQLTREEREHIQEHPVIGDRLIGTIKSLQHLRAGIRNHHERYDGNGYPDRLIGDEIPPLARIMAVADSCDAMMAARPYRPALSPDRIDEILRAGAGSQWDPRVVEAFLACRQDVYSICQRGLGDSVFVAVERALRARLPHEEVSSAAPR